MPIIKFMIKKVLSFSWEPLDYMFKKEPKRPEMFLRKTITLCLKPFEYLYTEYDYTWHLKYHRVHGRCPNSHYGTYKW